MSWRPKDWNEQKLEDCKKCVSYGLGKRDCVICEMNYEAGADAMLKAFRCRGHHVNSSASFSSLGERCTLSNENNTGVYVFIPDDIWHEAPNA
jgi:hypothetical protein